MTTRNELVVRKSAVVRCSQARAFHIFTEEMSTWWPLATHSVFQVRSVACSIEGRVGGRIFERSEDGEESTWGTITAWTPPSRLAFTWHPGYDERLAGEVQVSFVAAGDETRVELVHRGFEKRGADAAAIRDSYNTGWGRVLVESFAAYVERAPGAQER